MNIIIILETWGEGGNSFHYLNLKDLQVPNKQVGPAVLPPCGNNALKRIK